jgi:hypothetical protein
VGTISMAVVVVLYVVTLAAFGWLCAALLVRWTASALRRKGCVVTTHYGLLSLRVRGFDMTTKTLYRLRVGRAVPNEPYQGLRLVRDEDPARGDGWTS